MKIFSPDQNFFPKLQSAPLTDQLIEKSFGLQNVVHQQFPELMLTPPHVLFCLYQQNKT